MSLLSYAVHALRITVMKVVKSSLHTKKMLSGVLSRWSTTMGRKMVETFFKSWSGFVEKERRERIDTELVSETHA